MGKGKFDYLRTQKPGSPGTQKAATAEKVRGKRNDPNYEQVTAYIRRETYTAVKIELLKEGRIREFSELVQELLDGWLKGGRV